MYPRPLIAALCIPLLLSACAGHKPGPVVVPEAESTEIPGPFAATAMAVLSCPDLAPMGLLFNDHAVRIDAPHMPRDLLQVMAASGSRYEAGGNELWLKGEVALYRQGGEELVRECRADSVADAWESAALRGVSFRAVGNEPGWYMEVVPDKWVLLISDYGSRRYVIPPVAPQAEGDAQRFRGEAGDVAFDLLATPGACSDGMSDQVYDTQVSLLLDGQALRGCGRWLMR